MRRGSLGDVDDVVHDVGKPSDVAACAPGALGNLVGQHPDPEWVALAAGRFSVPCGFAFTPSSHLTNYTTIHTPFEAQERRLAGATPGPRRGTGERTGADPKPASPRLRLPGFDHEPPEFTSAHVGARFFGMGAVAAIRNLATHRPEEPDEQVALEQLAAMSSLARWVDAAASSRLSDGSPRHPAPPCPATRSARRR
jgi:Protein of unknown function (Hypoth_ymh)